MGKGRMRKVGAGVAGSIDEGFYRAITTKVLKY